MKGMARKKVLFVHAAYASNMSLHRRRASSIMRYRSPASARLLTSASSSGVTSDGSRAGAVDDSPRNHDVFALCLEQLWRIVLLVQAHLRERRDGREAPDVPPRARHAQLQELRLREHLAIAVVVLHFAAV